MRTAAVIAAIAIVAAQAGTAGAADAATRQRQSVVIRSAAGTVIQPTRTIIHNPNGTTTVIITPRRSYLNPGTDVSVGYGTIRDYVLPPGGDPGRPNWFYGPDLTGSGGYPLPRPFYLPGFNPDTPF